jgi:intein/homing endonuclease
MDRHRKLFDERRWGLIVYDECLTGDTVIETLDGRKTFAELDAEYGFEEGWTTDVDITVQSFDQNSGEYVMSDVSGVYKTQAPVERIETNTGDVLTATPGHTHLVFDPETGSIDDQAGVEEGTYLVQPSPGVDVDVDRNPVSMSDEAVRAELLGWFIGDGHYDSHRHITFSFGRNAEEQIRIISRLCDQIGVSYTTFANTRGDITLVSTDLDSELPWSGDTGRKVESIRVPADSYRWDHDARAALLRGLFDAEGSVDKKGRIQFNTVSGGLADDVSNLMQKMGILTRRMRRERIEQDYSDVHRLNIPSFYGEAFSRAVGFRLEHKSERVSTGESPATGLPIGPLLASLKEKLGLTNDDLAEMADVSRQTIGGVIRGEHNLGKPAIDELGDGLESYADTEISDPAAARKSFGVTYERLSDEIGCTEGGSHSKLQRSSETAIRALSTILEERRETATEFAQRLKTVTNLTVVEVIDKEHVGQEVVYDFETETHTFLADGFLTHNCHHIPSPVYSLSADLQGKHRLGLTATPTRESDDEEEIFTLVGPPIGTDWSALFEAGFVQEPEVNIRLVPWGDDAEADEYVSAVGHGRRQAAADNSAKIDEIRYILQDHPAAKALIFVEYLDLGDGLALVLDLPFISGEMPHARREKLFDEFRMGQRDALVVSRVGDEGIDLPDAELAIIASGLGGSRRQGAQRAGRTMRPVGDAVLYVLATRGTEEEDFVRRQMRHLASKGIRVTESESEVGDVRESTLEEPPSSDSGESGSVD